MLALDDLAYVFIDNMQILVSYELVVLLIFGMRFMIWLIYWLFVIWGWYGPEPNWLYASS